MNYYRYIGFVFLLCSCGWLKAETVAIVVPANAAPRVQYGLQKLEAALQAVQLKVVEVPTANSVGRDIILSRQSGPVIGSEDFLLSTTNGGNIFIVSAADSGALYGCLELAKRIHAAGGLPADLYFHDGPKFTLRGTCIGMQKTYILPGHKVYEYPYTPNLFPFFYDKKFWQEYLDFLAANRMNTLYLWNGHPFSSLVRLPDYPEAIEVPPDVFAQNVEMFHYITSECDRRGIWLVQMFYNILLPKPLADEHGLPTQMAAPVPLASDYTRKVITEFVRQYPNVGLMACLGEALQGTDNQLFWCTNVILPGMLDGMKAAGLTTEPPLVIRTHAMDPDAIIPTVVSIYTNLYTETKYNGESLTTWEPRGKDQLTHLAMSKLSPHLVNIHILSNLEPFRYGDQQFIQKCMQASRDRLGATGVHLYPLCYWNWPYSADNTTPPLKQWERDWIWYEAWARYAWNPDVPAAEDHAYWIARLTEHYGNPAAAEQILDAYNFSGECAPRLIRRFGITEGNRETLSLGITLDQLVHPDKYGAISDLWESQAPPGERLQDYVEREWKHEAHVGETPVSIIREVLDYSHRAVAAADAAEPLVTKNRDEFERLRNDTRCIEAMSENYAAKATAAQFVLRYQYSHDLADMETAETNLAESLVAYQKLAALTATTYRFANAMQTAQRKIPLPGGVRGVGTNYHWVQLVPFYERELKNFQAQVMALREHKPVPVSDETPPSALPPAAFKLLSTNAETYVITKGAKIFTDREFTIRKVTPELRGLTGIRFSASAAEAGHYTPIEFMATEPVQVLVGYFKSDQPQYLPVPKLEFAAQADDRGGLASVIENAATIIGCPAVDVHVFRFDTGPQKLEMIGQGSFVVLGIVPQSVTINPRDAHFPGSKP